MKIPSISFGSTYKIKNYNLRSESGTRDYFFTVQYCNKNNLDYDCKLDVNTDSKEGRRLSGIITTIVIPDEKDLELENFFQEQNIHYSKYFTNSLFYPCVLNSRVNESPKGYKTVCVNLKKLEKLVKRQSSSSYEYYKKDYYNHSQKDSEFMLKSGDKFNCDFLYLTPFDDDLLKELSSKKLKTIPKDSISIDIVSGTSDKNINMFFAMANAGINEIPVYVDNDSFALGSQLGIFI